MAGDVDNKIAVQLNAADVLRIGASGMGHACRRLLATSEW